MSILGKISDLYCDRSNPLRSSKSTYFPTRILFLVRLEIYTSYQGEDFPPSREQGTQNSTRLSTHSSMYLETLASQESHRRSYHVSEQERTGNAKGCICGRGWDPLARASGYTDVSRSRGSTGKEERGEKEREDAVRRKREQKFGRHDVVGRQYKVTWWMHRAACRNVGAPLPLAGGARGWAGFLSRQRARIHPVHVGTEGFRIDRRPGEQPCSDWLSQTARPCRVDGFLARRNEESRTSELSSWLPLVEQQPRARPKRTTDEEGVCSRIDRDDGQTHAQEGGRGKR